jgi:hypothetical protein
LSARAAYKLRLRVDGERATLYFECLWVDETTRQIKAHNYSNDVLVRIVDKWMIKDMNAGDVGEM